MSGVFVHGLGAVSPAGWGVESLRAALAEGTALPTVDLIRPGWDEFIKSRQVPPAQPRPGFMAHPRLRRASPVSRFAVGAALEALGKDAAAVADGTLRFGLVLAVMTGCVNYSRRFYDEVLKDPPSASPLVFPETVFNAPASHLAALLGAPGLNYTLVGDPGVFLEGLALGANWLREEQVDGCLVVGAEEIDWITADSFRLFVRRLVLAEGAGAVYLRRERRAAATVELQAVTNAQLFLNRQNRATAAARMRRELPAGDAGDLLVEGTQELARYDAPENGAWRDWPGARLAPKRVLGEGLAAAAAWQCVAAIDALLRGDHPAANVSVVGCNEQAVGARFVRAR